MIVFLLMVLSALYLSLSAGLTIEKLSFGPLQIRQLYIKWDNRALLHCRYVGLDASDDQEPLQLKQLHRTAFRLLEKLYGGWFEYIDIDQIELDGYNASLHFCADANSTFDLHSDRLRSRIRWQKLPDTGRIHLGIDAISNDFNATVLSDAIVDLETQHAYLLADINISNRVFLTLPLQATTEALHLNLFSPKPFGNVADIVIPMQLDPEVEQWIVRRAEAQSHMLHSLRTTVPYDEPSKAVALLDADLTAYKVRYAFTNDPDAFEPVEAEKVSVTFQDSILNIKPYKSLFYGIRGESTWLNIDFNGPDAVLNLYLHLKAPFSPPIHRLIASYGIDLPFVQTHGVTKADMELHINLATNTVEDSGFFVLRDAQIDFSGIAVVLPKADVQIQGSSVTIVDANASLFDDRLTTRIAGTFDPARSTGSIGFTVSDARYDFNMTSIALSSETSPVRLSYLLNENGDHIRAERTRWTFGDHTLMLNGFDAPFRFKDFTLDLPSTLLRFNQNTKAYLSGKLDLKSPDIDLKADLLSFEFGKIANNQPFIPLNLSYDGNLTISTHNKTRWKADETNVLVRPFSATLQKGNVYIEPTPVTIENFLKGTVQGVHEFSTGATELNISNFTFDNAELGELLRKDQQFKVYIIPDENSTEVIVPSLYLLYSVIGKGWRLHFFSLESLAEDSQLMQDYNVTKGTFTAYSEDGDFPVTFAGTVEYPYALTVQNGVAVSEYHYVGTIGESHDINITLNDTVNIYVNGKIVIHANHVGFSQPEFTRFYKDHRAPEGSQNGKEVIPIVFDANDTFIQFEAGRKAPADTLNMQYRENIIAMQLFHGPGGIVLEAENDEFFLFGKDLDDRFMDSFFKLSDFNGGRFSFYAAGKGEVFNGLARIDDTTIYDYALFNNLFAFFNTVPALITFSVPGYSSKGFKIKSAYAKLDYREGILDISGIKIDSDELDVAGTGKLNYNSDTMDMNLTLKTQASENLRKIPLVGYILVGDDQSVLTTVSVSGPIEDPVINTTIAEDIIVAPFNILKRTINFPLHYLEKYEKAEKPKTKKSPHSITSGVKNAH